MTICATFVRPGGRRSPLCDAFQAKHEASRARRELLAVMLRKAREAFGDVAVAEVDARLIAG